MCCYTANRQFLELGFYKIGSISLINAFQTWCIHLISFRRQSLDISFQQLLQIFSIWLSFSSDSSIQLIPYKFDMVISNDRASLGTTFSNHPAPFTCGSSCRFWRNIWGHYPALGLFYSVIRGMVSWHNCTKDPNPTSKSALNKGSWGTSDPDRIQLGLWCSKLSKLCTLLLVSLMNLFPAWLAWVFQIVYPNFRSHNKIPLIKDMPMFCHICKATIDRQFTRESGGVLAIFRRKQGHKRPGVHFLMNCGAYEVGHSTLSSILARRHVKYYVNCYVIQAGTLSWCWITQVY